jgi:hypothetical protein
LSKFHSKSKTGGKTTLLAVSVFLDFRILATGGKKLIDFKARESHGLPPRIIAYNALRKGNR